MQVAGGKTRQLHQGRVGDPAHADAAARVFADGLLGTGGGWGEHQEADEEGGDEPVTDHDFTRREMASIASAILTSEPERTSSATQCRT